MTVMTYRSSCLNPGAQILHYRYFGCRPCNCKVWQRGDENRSVPHTRRHVCRGWSRALSACYYPSSRKLHHSTSSKRNRHSVQVHLGRQGLAFRCCMHVKVACMTCQQIVVSLGFHTIRRPRSNWQARMFVHPAYARLAALMVLH